MNASDRVWRAAWWVPLLIAVHNAEEGATMREWLAVHREEVVGVFARFGLTRLTASILEPDAFAARYITALIIATLVPLLVVAVAQAVRNTASLYAVIAIQAVMFANVFSHIGTAVLSLGYAPGVLTAVGLNLPFSLYFFQLVRRDGAISARALRIVVVCGVLAMLPLTLLALMLGGRLAAH